VFGPAKRADTSTGFQSHVPRGLLLRLRTRLRRPWLDDRIAREVGRPGDHALTLREAQLVGPRARRRLARRLERILTERPRPTAASSAIPIDHEALKVAKPILTEVILTLHSSEVVEARGVVLGWRLLTRGSSPLYAPNRPSTGDLDCLRYAATLVLVTLQPNAWPTASEPAR
jgi:hypothetical protein